MKITKYGHACLFVEEAGARILIDPGAFSEGFEQLEQLDAILITHQHGDHLVPDNLVALLERSPQAHVVTDEGSAKILADDGRIAARAVKDGDTFDVAGVTVLVAGVNHAVIHPEISGIPNVGYHIGGRFFYPGDNFTQPAHPVEVLALPLGAPWLKVSEVIDYLMMVKPKVAIPVHDAVLAMPDMHIGLAQRFAKPAGIVIEVVANKSSTEV